MLDEIKQVAVHQKRIQCNRLDCWKFVSRCRFSQSHSS